MKLWVDDERTPPDESWVWAQTCAGAIEVMLTAEEPLEVLSLDYVLGRGDTTDTIMYWLKSRPADRWPVTILAHSSSASARELIEEMVREFRP